MPTLRRQLPASKEISARAHSGVQRLSWLPSAHLLATGRDLESARKGTPELTTDKQQKTIVAG